MNKTVRTLASSAFLASVAIIGTTAAHAQTDAQAWATIGSSDGGGPGGGAAPYNSNIGGGGFNFHNGPIIGDWDDFADFGDLIFNATFANASWDNTADISTNYIWNWGLEPDNTATYGQTFIAPSGAGNLMSFSFFLQGGNDGSYNYQGFVMSWEGSLIGGQSHDESTSTLDYASEPILYTPNGQAIGSGDFQEVTVTIGGGGLALTPGDAYLFGLSTLGVSQLHPVGPGIPSAPDTASTIALLVAALGGVFAFRRRMSVA
ncbi:MAG TPA: hypothetical protein VGL42_14185 [Opitutaceae bacterium]|jgi:hypothetical protein